jgi:hypothetical protein
MTTQWSEDRGLAGAVLDPLTRCFKFQVATNTAVMIDVAVARRGLISAILNLSRNLGLLTGAAAMGAVFAQATATPESWRRLRKLSRGACSLLR